MKHGFLLINLGTPKAPTVKEVRRYLRVFLADPRVLQLPKIVRYALLYGVILPFRARKTTEAYRAIWRTEGSPLLYYSQKMQCALQSLLGEDYPVVLAMRYGNPSISNGLEALSACDTITVLPLYPQYASATTGSVLANVLTLLARRDWIPSLRIVSDFYRHPAFIAAQAALIQPYIASHDHLLLSYHGLPKAHLIHPCYQTQCLETSRLLADALSLSTAQYSTSFQSRVGKAAWIEPYTEDYLADLRACGVLSLLVACPSFVADCLETLEEIGIRAKAHWIALGGEKLTLVPCLNDDPMWIDALKCIGDVLLVKEPSTQQLP